MQTTTIFLFYCRFLATGRTFKDMSFTFRRGVSTIRKAVFETCTAIWDVMQPQYMPMPTTEIWKESANRFRKMWNFPHCVAALDGKHCSLRCPPKTGSLHFNWKHSFSIVLLAAVDATYRFLWVDIGRSGGCSDSGLFRSTALGRKVMDTKQKEPPANLPANRRIKGSHNPNAMPYVFVGDEAFPLVNHVMRPYSGRKGNLSAKKIVFNYRLSRARRLVESAFGILASRNRVL